MSLWTKRHARFIGRIIFADLLELPLEKYRRFVEEHGLTLTEGNTDQRGKGRGGPRIKVRRLSRLKISVDHCQHQRKSASNVVAKIERTGNRFSVRYTYEGFNRMYVIDKLLEKEVTADPRYSQRESASVPREQSEFTESTSADIRVMHKARRINSRNALTHRILRGIIEHQEEFLRTGDPIDLVPLSQVELTDWMNRVQNFSNSELGTRSSEFVVPRSAFRVPSSICNSWVSRIINRLSIITPSGEEKPLKWFFRTRKDINKRLIKQILDKENKDLQSGKLKRPYTDNQLGTLLKTLLRKRDEQRFTNDASPSFAKASLYAKSLRRDKSEGGRTMNYSLSRHSIGHCRKDMGIPPAKRRLSGYKYPPLSANFSMLYSLVLEEVLKCAPASPGIYEFRLNPVRNKTQTALAISDGVKGKEIEYPNGKTNVIYIGSTRNIRKRLREHLGKNSKNGHIRDFLKNHGCSFRYIQFSKNWREEERRLYGLFVSTYGAPPKCNRVKPGAG